MPNVRLHIAYDGKSYHGWQIQPEVTTVEGAILRGLSRLLNQPVAQLEFQGASRTDAGVHAVGQVANFHHDTDRNIWDFVRGLNALTPDDICINHAEHVDAGFNARHDSRGKWYRYRIWNHRFVHPLERDRTWCVKHELDVARMQAAARHLVGEHDFSAFRAADCQAATTVRELTKIEVSAHDREIVVDVEGTAFLKYMVRILVGTLVEIGVGRREPDSVLDLLRHGDRHEAGPTAQPQGLCLMRVFYPNHPWNTEPKLGLMSRY